MRRRLAVLLLGIVPIYLVALVAYGGSPKTTDVGYAPEQPVPYSHALHAGDLGIDCRYCHTNVETAAHVEIPPTETCMNCHSKIRAQSPKLLPVRESYATGMPVPWIKVHDLPDYAYFDHSAHVNKGVGCTTCHGPVDTMPLVMQRSSLQMEWCLECHRAPERFLRPKEQVFSVSWHPPADQLEQGRELVKRYAQVPVCSAATAATRAAPSIGFDRCSWKPARSARSRSSSRANAVSAAAGIEALSGRHCVRTR